MQTISIARQKKWYFVSITCGKTRTFFTTLKVTVFLYEADGLRIKKSDKNRIEAFEMWRWRNILRMLWSLLSALNTER